MKSIKPGRGPSMRGGIAGIFAIAFGIFWTIMAGRMFFPMAIFGLFFIAIAVINTVRSFKNATGENRESMYDIVDSEEELDPYEKRFGKRTEVTEQKTHDGGFCPYCGAKAEKEYTYCANCGKKLP